MTSHRHRGTHAGAPNRAWEGFAEPGSKRLSPVEPLVYCKHHLQTENKKIKWTRKLRGGKREQRCGDGWALRLPHSRPRSAPRACSAGSPHIWPLPQALGLQNWQNHSMVGVEGTIRIFQPQALLWAGCPQQHAAQCPIHGFGHLQGWAAVPVHHLQPPLTQTSPLSVYIHSSTSP